MAQHRRENAFRIVTRQGKGIGMAYPGVGDFDQHFALLWRRDVNFHNFQRLARAKCDGCT